MSEVSLGNCAGCAEAETAKLQLDMTYMESGRAAAVGSCALSRFLAQRAVAAQDRLVEILSDCPSQNNGEAEVGSLPAAVEVTVPSATAACPQAEPLAKLRAGLESAGAVRASHPSIRGF